MVKPIETATDALRNAEWEVFVAEDGEKSIRQAWPMHADRARAALASLAQHRDDIARAMFEGDRRRGDAEGEWELLSADVREWYRDSTDDALAYLQSE